MIYLWMLLTSQKIIQYELIILLQGATSQLMENVKCLFPWLYCLGFA